MITAVQQMTQLVKTLENAQDHSKREGSFIYMPWKDWKAVIDATVKVVDVL